MNVMKSDVEMCKSKVYKYEIRMLQQMVKPEQETTAVLDETTKVQVEAAPYHIHAQATTDKVEETLEELAKPSP